METAGMAEVLSSTVEDYLGVIYLLQREGETAIGARLAERLGVSRPTVTVTLQRMERDGLVTLDEHKAICLTPTGLQAAQDILRRHMLAEWLLHEIIGLPWHQVHEEADRLEHGFSPAAVDRLASLFEQPATCPHGNPMPGSEPVPAVPLDEVKEGEEVIITRIVEEAELHGELLAFLEENGLLPGVRLRVASYRPCNETMTVEVGDATPEGPRSVVLGLATARLMRVRKES
jgi:DtxR family Mn-dependent transcriptional regulator